MCRLSDPISWLKTQLEAPETIPLSVRDQFRLYHQRQRATATLTRLRPELHSSRHTEVLYMRVQDAQWAARASLISSHLRLALNLATKFFRANPDSRYTINELYSVATESLFAAENKLDLQRGRMSTLAGKIVYRDLVNFRRRVLKDAMESIDAMAGTSTDSGLSTESRINEVEDRLDWGTHLDWLRRELAELPPDQREAVIDRFGLDGKPPMIHKEMAAKGNTTKEGARRRLESALFSIIRGHLAREVAAHEKRYGALLLAPEISWGISYPRLTLLLRTSKELTQYVAARRWERRTPYTAQHARITGQELDHAFTAAFDGLTDSLQFLLTRMYGLDGSTPQTVEQIAADNNSKPDAVRLRHNVARRAFEFALARRLVQLEERVTARATRTFNTLEN